LRDQVRLPESMRQEHHSSDCYMTRTRFLVSAIFIYEFRIADNTYQSPEIVPDLRYVRVQTNRAGVCVQGITILVNLIVENTDRAPECRIPSISVDCLLVRFIRLWVFRLRHVTASEKIPTLSIAIIYPNSESTFSSMARNVRNTYLR
jgi:hypothetical protein